MVRKTATAIKPVDLYVGNPVLKLQADVLDSMKLLTHDQARYLVSLFYTIQDYRIAVLSQVRAGEKAMIKEENPDLEPEDIDKLIAKKMRLIERQPTQVTEYLGQQFRTLEEEIGIALEKYGETYLAAQWARDILGIGPILSSGLVAYWGEPEEHLCVSNLWSFAGLNPTAEWKKGEKRPWNADLKVLSWKCGQQFMKLCNKETSLYGQLYKQVFKPMYIERNEKGLFKERAAQVLTEKNFKKDTAAYAAYSKGFLPKAHIDAMSRRKVVKIFLSHFAQVAYYFHHNKRIADPYVFAILGHKDKILVPNFAPDGGLTEKELFAKYMATKP